MEKVVLGGEGNDMLLRETLSPNEVMNDNAHYGPVNESESIIEMPQRLKTIPFWRKVYV